MVEISTKEHFDIFIIGVGGTGSHLTSFLTQLLGNNKDLKNKHRITLIDRDIVEEKNLRTQKFLSSDVGKSKAEVLSDRYSAVYDIDIGYIDSYIEDESKLKELISNSSYRNSIIVSCVDNNKARRIIDKVFNEGIKNRYYYSSLIYIDTGNSSGEEELTGQTVIGYRKRDQIILPSASTFFPQILEDEEEEVPQESCGEVMLKNIQNIGANITSACTVFNLINSILSFGIIPANLFTFNASRIESESISL